MEDNNELYMGGTWNDGGFSSVDVAVFHGGGGAGL